MRELQARLKAIDIRKHNQVATEASFHGIKIPFKVDEDHSVTFTEEQEAHIESELRAAQDKKSAEIRARNGQ